MDIIKKVKKFGLDIIKKVKKFGQEDPRRLTHSLKVGVALNLVSILYYCRTLYDKFGDSAMWAILTVVFVFEFSVGATLSRVLATLVGGALALGAYHLAHLLGGIGEPILIAFFVLIQAAISTFARFYPQMARYDYGLFVSILTFCLVSVSSLRDNEVWTLARQRLSTIAIGSFTCVIISILFFPVWAGEDLHNLVASNLEKLGCFLEVLGDEYFKMQGHGDSEDDKSMEEYKSVLDSKDKENALANYARLEPRHGRFRFRHPWDQYLKIADLTRQCAYRIESLKGHLKADIQVKPQIQGICTQLSSESGKALKELAWAIQNMLRPNSAYMHIGSSKSAVEKLNCLLKPGSWSNDMDPFEFVPLASLLIDVISCTEEIAEAVQEFASMLG